MTLNRLVLFIMLILSITECMANIRAPKNSNHPPSSVLFWKSVDVTVLQEKMDVLCDRHVCDVTVKYILQVNKEFSTTVDFMLPGEVEVSVQIGENSPPIKVKPVVYGKDPREKNAGNIAFSGLPGQLYRASFPLSLVPGIHEVLVQYKQPLSLKEVDYGYFSEGYFFGKFQYELWPIKEWKIAPDFNLNLTITLTSKSLRWWEKLVDEYKVNCKTTTFTSCEDTGGYMPEICGTSKNIESSTPLDPFVIKIQMQLPLPDRLSCEIGKKE